MLVAGAGRHAKDLVASFSDDKYDLVFFDDLTTPTCNLFLNEFQIINTLAEAKEYFTGFNEFILGLGGTAARKKVFKKLTSVGGTAVNFISEKTRLGGIDVVFGNGLNIMPYVFISNSVKVGKGTLLNVRTSLHHDVTVGIFCDIAPGAVLLGGVEVGNYSKIGSNATVLPDIKIGSNCVVGAGSVVNKNVPNGSIVAGVPANGLKNANS